MRTLQRRSAIPQTGRSGLTWIDVLVLISITLTLAAVILPAMNQPRPMSKRVECLNNMKTIVTAESNFAEKHQGQLTWICETYGSDADDSVLAPWTYALLPYLDNGPLFREIQRDPRTFQNGTPLLIKVFQCVADDQNAMKPGGLSYVANAGYIRADIFNQTAPDWMLGHSLTAVDWNQNGMIDNDDLQIAFSTGAFWPKTPDSQADADEERLTLLKRPMTLDYIASHDGQQHTILFAENKQALNWQRADALHDFAFGVPVNPVKDFDGAQGRPLDFNAGFAATLEWQNALPNNNPAAKPGTAARPSSNHLGTGIYGFADGSARMISDDIDWSVYVRLLTPNGQEYGQSEKGIEQH